MLAVKIDSAVVYIEAALPVLYVHYSTKLLYVPRTLSTYCWLVHTYLVPTRTYWYTAFQTLLQYTVQYATYTVS